MRHHFLAALALAAAAFALPAQAAPLAGAAPGADTASRSVQDIGFRRYSYGDPDPYAYDYRPRGYYPYYDSDYWKPRYAYRGPDYYYYQPPYYEAWGYPRRRFYRKRWGYHRRGRW